MHTEAALALPILASGSRGTKWVGQCWCHCGFGAAPKLIKTDDVCFEAMNLREKAIGDSSAITWTALQKVQIVMNEASLLTNPTPAKVAAQFEKRVTFAPSSDKFATGFVDAAMTITNRILSIPACKEMLTKLDSEVGVNGPLNSVYKLQAIVSKAKTPANIQTVISYMVFGYECGFYEVEDFSVSKLRSGFVDLLLLKKSLLTHFMDVSFHELSFPPDDVSLIRRCYADTAAVTLWAKSPRGEQKQPDLFWKAGLSKPANMFSDFVEAIVYDVKFDANLKHAIKYSKTAAAVLCDYQAPATTRT